MIKQEIKIELSDILSIRDLIEKSYFEDGQFGKIVNNKFFLEIKETDINYDFFKGLNNVTVKISNDEIIDGFMRFIIDESDEKIKLYPISIYCIKENEKYIFY